MEPAGSVVDLSGSITDFSQSMQQCRKDRDRSRARKGNPSSALSLFDKMQMDSDDSLQHAAFLPLLKACTKLKDVDKGIEIHSKVARLGLVQRDMFIGCALVDMYAKCGLLRRAYETFEKLPSKDVVAWTSLVTGYVEHGHGEEALKFFQQMQLEGVSPDLVTFSCSLKACGSVQAMRKGGEIHALIGKTGFLEQDLVVGTTLVDMYSKGGYLFRAQEIFDNLEVRDVVAWNALIGGYAEHGKGEEALNCFELMRIECLSPDVVTFSCSLKACGIVKAVHLGHEIHSEIERKGLLEGEILVGNMLVDMYAKFGFLDTAHQVFDMIPMQDVVSWTSLISGYAEYGNSEEALMWFEKMQIAGVSPNAATYVSILKACGNMYASEKGRYLHAEIERKGLVKSDIIIGNTLIDMYAKCGLLYLAQEVFDKLLVRDVVSWTTLITGYAEHGHDKEALKCFQQMQLDGVSPNAMTFVSSLKSCGSLGATGKGQEIHAEIERKGLLKTNVLIGNTLLDMYAKCGSLSLAQQVFDNLHARDVVSWTTLITGYAEHGHGKQAVQYFEQMQRQGISPNAATYVCSLKACGSIGAIEKAAEIHSQIEKDGLLEREPVVGNTLIDMYAKFGILNKAQNVFDKLKFRDVVSWTALIAGYAEHGHGEEALQQFEQMKLDGIFPNAVTFVCGLKACCNIGATEKGRELHSEIERKGLLASDVIVGNTLVDMYAQWGSLIIAQHVFDELPARDAIACNSLIAGYAQAGKSESAFHVFERMLGEQIKPDPITFIIVLNACSRAGLSSKSKTYFESMSKDFGIIPTLEHHAGLVDLLCRVGQLDKAVSIIKKMPFSPNLVVWNTVLGACRYNGNVELGKHAFEHSLDLDEKDPAAYILMSQICAAFDIQ